MTDYARDPNSLNPDHPVFADGWMAAGWVADYDEEHRSLTFAELVEIDPLRAELEGDIAELNEWRRLTYGPSETMVFHLIDVDRETLTLIFGEDIWPPLCEQEIPSRGTE